MIVYSGGNVDHYYLNLSSELMLKTHTQGRRGRVQGAIAAPHPHPHTHTL
jgi:hypothetical protein